jgi:hypothetical protein
MHDNIILILGPNSVFGLWRPTIAFLTPKSIHFVHLYKIFDRLMGHMTCFFWASSAPPRRASIFLMLWQKFIENYLRKIWKQNFGTRLNISAYLTNLHTFFKNKKKIKALWKTYFQQLRLLKDRLKNHSKQQTKINYSNANIKLLLRNDVKS